MAFSWLLSFVTLAAVTCCVRAENILFLQTTPSKSHHIWNRQIFDRLYENGHNLTILSFEQETSVPGKTFLVMEGFYEQMMAAFSDGSTDFSSYEHAFGNIMGVYQYYTVCGRILEEQDAIKRLLDYPKTFRFDLIIHDFTMGQFLLGFVEHFRNPPLVSISPYNIPSYTQYLADIPLYPTYVPHPASSFSAQMTFIERVKNTLYWGFDMLYRQQVFMPNENQRMKRVFPGANLTHVKLLERRSELVLVNSDPAIDFYQLLPPNVVQVGGLHIKRAEEMPSVSVHPPFGARESLIEMHSFLSDTSVADDETIYRTRQQGCYSVQLRYERAERNARHGGEPPAAGTVPQHARVRFHLEACERRKAVDATECANDFLGAAVGAAGRRSHQASGKPRRVA